MTRLQWLKRHFERVLILDREGYEVVQRASGWLSAVAATLAYLWFFLFQATFGRRMMTVGWGLFVVAFVSAVAYASRDRLKEIGRNWLAGRVQKMFAQRVTRYRPPTRDGRRYPPLIVARESFSRSVRPADPLNEQEPLQDVTVVRFSHQGQVVHSATEMSPLLGAAPRVRLLFRLDLSGLLPRLKDAVRGFATPDGEGSGLTIVDVPRNYAVPVRARFRVRGSTDEGKRTLIVNKNGLVRLDD